MITSEQIREKADYFLERYIWNHIDFIVTNNSDAMHYADIDFAILTECLELDLNKEITYELFNKVVKEMIAGRYITKEDIEEPNGELLIKNYKYKGE